MTQILAWGSSFFLLGVLEQPIACDTGWPVAWIVGGLSLGLLVAGIVSPLVGDKIQRFGGRLVLATSAAFLAAGLIGLALSPNLLIYIVSWLVLGVGMGAGLYDPAFATLGRIYGQRARTAIATLTLFGGFASTISWPLSAMLVSEFGWRSACLIYAGMDLFVLLPIYVFALPKEQKRETRAVVASDRGDLGERPLPPGSRLLFMLMVLVITISSISSTLLSVYLLTILQARGIGLAAAVALGAIVGPCQVGARAIDMAISRFHHPIWTKIASTVFVAVGVGLLWANAPIVTVALVFYGAGIGLESIARGTLPLAVFGDDLYPSIMGRIAMPSLIMQAASPSLGAQLITRLGTNGALAMLFAVAIINVLLVLALFGTLEKPGTADRV
ncbi:MFS transporter [Mesorhizobium amorphae]|uniref:Major facilitator superfamily protein n=1 Tax=Mesorhizobium amorphae CCNWGS0123 TaxID=1082933 RepID=G6Y3R8_9HYPH|nr:MFS transporter [Mesorhizobium amorphae]ANT54903.1 MFS transporter [Mesorhizobium amorphae CCNWGS0123]EHH13614.1 major facilitator superfamily protein [Mesorhizobium amorphae CCNWGS0123]